jgi:nicotinamide-nucleotide amidase
MHAEIVMIGTELLLGEIVDSNATLLAKMLRDIGLDLYYKSTVGDNEERIVHVLNLALDRAPVVITSGGLGPTVDDMTRAAVARATGRELVYSPELEAQILARFRAFGREMGENNKRQAYIPAGALPLPNAAGTAPCFLSEDTRGRGFIISLPGVPRELEYMMTHTVLPLLINRMGGAKSLKVRVLRSCAVGESNVDRALGDLMTLHNPTVGLAVHIGQTDIRIAAKADTEAQADALLDPLEAEIRRRLGVAIYGVEQETLPDVTGRILVEKGLSLALLDTLTGGQLAHELVEAGFGDLLLTNLRPASPSEALQAVCMEEDLTSDGPTLAADLAAAIAPDKGIALALIGPLPDSQAHNATFIALHGPGGLRLVRRGRNFQDNDFLRHWLFIQGLDWVRRAALGQLESPAD